MSAHPAPSEGAEKKEKTPAEKPKETAGDVMKKKVAEVAEDTHASVAAVTNLESGNHYPAFLEHKPFEAPVKAETISHASRAAMKFVLAASFLTPAAAITIPATLGVKAYNAAHNVPGIKHINSAVAKTALGVAEGGTAIAKVVAAPVRIAAYPVAEVAKFSGRRVVDILWHWPKAALKFAGHTIADAWTHKEGEHKSLLENVVDRVKKYVATIMDFPDHPVKSIFAISQLAAVYAVITNPSLLATTGTAILKALGPVLSKVISFIPGL